MGKVSEEVKRVARQHLADYADIDDLIEDGDWRELAEQMVDFYDAEVQWDRACTAILKADPSADCPSSQLLAFERALDRWDESFSLPPDDSERDHARDRFGCELQKLARAVYGRP